MSLRERKNLRDATAKNRDKFAYTSVRGHLSPWSIRFGLCDIRDGLKTPELGSGKGEVKWALKFWTDGEI